MERIFKKDKTREDTEILVISREEFEKATHKVIEDNKLSVHASKESATMGLIVMMSMVDAMVELTKYLFDRDVPGKEEG